METRAVLDAVSLLAGAITCISLILAIWQLRSASASAKQAAESTGRLKGVETTLEGVSRSLSTQPLGAFPDYIPVITQVVRDAKSVHIVADYAAYGSFSAPEQARDLVLALHKVRLSGGIVNLAIPPKEEMLRSLQEQFNSRFELEGGWTRWRAQHDEQIRRYCSVWAVYLRGSRTAEQVRTPSDLWEINTAVNEAVLAEIQPNKVETIPVVTTAYWIRNESEQAVFAMLAYADVIDHGFMTSDPRIIEALKQSHRRLINRVTTDRS
ncbi:MAG: hypothetical protein R3B49_09455 [Phycisphaerales bacterium]